MGKYCARSSLPAARGWKPRALRDAGNEIPSGLTHTWLRCSAGWGYGVSCNGAAPVGTRLPQIPLGVSPGGRLFPSRGVAVAVLLCQTPKIPFPAPFHPPHRHKRGRGKSGAAPRGCQAQPWLAAVEVPMSPRFPLPRRGKKKKKTRGKKKKRS